MTHCLNTLANLIQQYIWLAPVLALLGGLVTSFTPSGKQRHGKQGLF